MYSLRNAQQEITMPQKPSGYHRPQILAEALSLLTRPDTLPLAGGTTLLAGDVNGAVVDLQDLGLDQTELAGSRLVVGAMIRLADMAAFLEQNGRPGDPAALLQMATRQAGPNTFRNAGTLGGLIAGRPADSELLAALLVLEAELTLQWAGQEPFTLSLADYLSAGERPVGLITEVTLSWQTGQGASERVARTPADDPIVAITGWRPAGGTIRLAATGISERPLRLTAAEAALANGLDDSTIEQASTAAHDSPTHPGDFRGDAAYRAEMAAVLVRRVLAQLG
jgi:CO/xanthine dehydrogenase FAD-binding subunit